MRQFTYEFRFDSGELIRFTVDLERAAAPVPDRPPPAPWADLGYHQCSICPLRTEASPHCPVALDLQEVAAGFSQVLSYTEAEIVVISEERTYGQRMDVQSGLKSLLGLIMGSSACPVLSRLRPMAWFHLPFASVDETIYRVAGAFLLREYYAHRDGREPQLALPQLDSLYGDLQSLNRDFMTRLRAASQRDANLNAVNILFSLSAVVALTWTEKLDELRALFPDLPSPSPGP